MGSLLKRLHPSLLPIKDAGFELITQVLSKTLAEFKINEHLTECMGRLAGLELIPESVIVCVKECVLSVETNRF